MNAILSQFSITVLIRQFFCGVVFFLPLLLVYGADDNFCRLLLKSESSFAVGLFVVLSCIVGTIIHHLEKNTYSYALQYVICYMYIDSQEGRNCKYFRILLFFISSLAVVFSFKFPYYAYLILLAVLIASIIIPVVSSVETVLCITQKLWVISSFSKRNSNEHLYFPYARERNAVLTRLDAWSDNIHCVQASCFAWLFGLGFAHFLIQQSHAGLYLLITWSEKGVDYTTWRGASLSAELLHQFGAWSTCVAIFLLILEACFERHRFQHIFYIVEGIELPFHSSKKRE